jgi:predicted phosphodiesterase
MTRILVLSDIHSNYQALEAVLQDAEHHGPFDLKLSAGDQIGYGSQPNEVLNRLVKEDFICVAGNHERVILNKEYVTYDSEYFQENIRPASEHNDTILTAKNRDFLKSLSFEPLMLDFGLSMVHGSFHGVREKYEDTYVRSRSKALDAILSLQSTVGILGHTHLPMFASGYTGSFATGVVDFEFHLPHWQQVTTGFGNPSKPNRRRILFNPGSVGQPRDGCSLAAYGIITKEQDYTFDYHHVGYDIAETQRLMQEQGFPRHLVERLDVGC